MMEDEVVLIEDEPATDGEPPAGFEDVLYEAAVERELEARFRKGEEELRKKGGGPHGQMGYA
jgi:hypothetical protein